MIIKNESRKKIEWEKEMNKIQQCLCDAPKVVSLNFEYDGETTTDRLCAGCRDDPDFANVKNERVLQ